MSPTPSMSTTPFTITSQPQINGTLHFELHFNRMPDFMKLDANGRPADSFQIYVAFDPATTDPVSPALADVIIRGDEIHLAGDLRVRDAKPAASDPNCGGWGAIRGSVPFHVKHLHDGTAKLLFDISFALLGITGKFSYVVETFAYGATQGSVSGVAL